MLMCVGVEAQSDGCYTAPLKSYNDFDGCEHMDHFPAKLLVVVKQDHEIKCGKHVKIEDSQIAPKISIKNFNVGPF